MSQYFSSSNKKGELQELSDDLNSISFERKKEAVKKVIAQMSVGKDLSQLFQSIIKCLEHPEIELKKLVYLYIINYSRNRPDDAIMVINLFRKDVLTGTPLIRALAVRTMGCLRVKKLNEYLGDPLKGALNDEDAYVRKTAALCVPKVYELNPQLVESHGMIEKLQNLLERENNAIVIANVVIALYEIQKLKGLTLLNINQSVMQKLLIAINECIEWGQVIILDCLTNYIPNSAQETENIIERITPRLAHINPAVVFSAIKVLVKFMDYLKNPETIRNLAKKVSQPLVSLVSWDQPEIQFIILKNTSLLLQKRPNLIEKGIKSFFCKFNEPYYIRREKLDILLFLCDNNNFELLLNEFREYAQDFDAEFSRKAIKSIGKIAINIEKSIDKALEILVQLLKMSPVPHVIEEIMINMQNIYRKYPKKFRSENSLREIQKHFDEVQQPEAKAAAAWIVGEFAEEIEKPWEILQEKISAFQSEERIVQLSFLTAGVKLFLKFPDEAEEMMTRLLTSATENSDNPDVRDRAYIYWRMLSSEPEKTKKVVLNNKPIFTDEIFRYDTNFIDIMMSNLGLVSSIVHKIPEQMFKKKQASEINKTSPTQRDEKQSPLSPQKKSPTRPEYQNDTNNVNKNDFLEEFKEIASPDKNYKNQQKQSIPQDMDLLDIGFDESTSNQQQQPQLQAQSQPQQLLNNQLNLNDDQDDFFSSIDNSKKSKIDISFTSSVVPLENVLQLSQQGVNGQNGLKIEAAFNRSNQQIFLELDIQNQSQQTVCDIDMQMKNNFFNLNIDQSSTLKDNQINAGSNKKIFINIIKSNNLDSTAPAMPLTFTVGFKCNLDVFYFNIPCMFHILLDNCSMTKDYFKNLWKQIPDSNEINYEINKINPLYQNTESLKQILQKNNFIFVAQRINDNQQNVLYFAAKSVSNVEFLTEISLPSLQNVEGCSIYSKSMQSSLFPQYLQSIQFILNK